MKSERVAILGASDNPERYSYKALKMLKQHGHQPLPVSPRHEQIEGYKVYHDLSELREVDTLTMYVGAQISTALADKILQLGPKRVIFNPGSENPELEHKLEAQGIGVERACTLVLLSTDQF